MASRNYYYLVSSLPEVVLEQSKSPYSVPEFLELMRASLHPDDFRQVRLILLPYSHPLVLAFLQKTAVASHPWSPLSYEELAEHLKEPGTLPTYLHRIYEAYRQETPLYPNMSWENQLTASYYEYALAESTGFLHDWLTFERDLNNVLVGWNCRQFGYSLEGQLIGVNEVATAIQTSHARDFGLYAERPYVYWLLDELEDHDLLEREQDIDRIKWNFIEEANTFHYFSVEVILGYLLKLIMLERWLRLDAPTGSERINYVIRTLADSAGIPE